MEWDPFVYFIDLIRLTLLKRGILSNGLVTNVVEEPIKLSRNAS